MASSPICRLEDIPDPGSIDLQIEGEACFAVRRGQSVQIYRNSCPHVGAPLNLMPGQFLDLQRQYIQCSTHGALFEMDTGHCIAGPCRNQSLQAKPCTLIDGEIYLGDGLENPS